MDPYREVEDGPVVVAAFGGNVFGMAPGTGRVLWEQRVQYGGGALALAITPTAIFVAATQSLTCLRYPDGAPLWSAPTRGLGRSTLLVVGQRIFVGMAGEVECFSLDGRPLWHEHFKGKGNDEVALGVPGAVAQADERG